jgi:hypothetical protein
MMTMVPTPQPPAQVVVLSTTQARRAAQEQFVFEDGWVFREHHGKYVECICRAEEFRAAVQPRLAPASL